KLDETSSYGDIINLKQEYDIPFSYITFGQDVPEDIDKADPEILYNYLMGDFDE
ncbi:MAG: flagellar biosynthesis protein FlhF, partial [Bacillota bacterium]